jgi:hypothetical protein
LNQQVHTDRTIRNNKRDSNGRQYWGQLEIFIEKVPEQRTGKTRNQVTTENSHTGHSTYNLDSKGKGKVFPLQA